MDLIAFYADNALIKKATSAEETPTPGYLYHEIVGITHKSVEACQNLENVLMSRLENESPIVKLKTLRTIKHILQKGHVTVKRDLMGRVASIRPCLHARGPPDALRGDALWQSVRSEAQDVMNIIFDTEQRATAAPVAVSSMGSDQMGARSYSNGNTSNSNNYASSNSNYEAANANYISSSSTKSYGSGAGGSGTGTSSFGSNNSPFSQDIKNKISSLPSKIMGNTRPSHELSNFGSLNAAVTHASPHAHTSAGAVNDWAYAPPTTSSQSSDEESGLVDDITNAGGSSSLSFQALEQFCTRSALLDQYKIAELLIRKLEARTWQVRHKALSAIESLLLSSTGSVIRDICIERHAVFESLLGGMQAATREKAKQILTLLGISIESLPAPTPISSSSSPYSPPPPASQVSSPSHFEQEPEPANPPSSLFAGLSIASPTTHPEPEQAYNPPTPQQLISIDNTDGEEEKVATIARNTSLLSFLEASANVPPSPSILRDLGSTAPPNENDDSPLISSSPGPSQPSLSMTPLSFGSPLPETAPSPLIDLSNDVSDSPDILSKFRNNNPLKSSSPLPATSNGINSSLSSSQPISPPTSSFLAELMETPPPSSLEELLATPGTFLAPSTAPPSNNNNNNNISMLSYTSSPFGVPAKVAMVPNAQLKHAPSTIPQSALQQYQQQQLPLNFNLPPQPAPGSIKTTSATSVFNPVYSVPRAVSSPTTSSSSYSSPSYSSSSSSSSSSFNFVQQKKGDAFGDLVSIQIKQMGK